MEDFALFIPSHNRIKHFDALNLLKRSNYNGLWYVVISTDNHEIQEYKKIIPQKNLLIFDKTKIKCDTILSSKNLKPNSAIYARNFIINYAKKKYKYFGMMDDDITDIKFRINANGVMKAMGATRCLNEIIATVLDFLKKSDSIGGIAFSSDKQYFGGIKSLDKIEREIFNFVFLKSNDIREYRGFYVEDAIYSSWNFDKVYLSIKSMCFIAPSPGTNNGGVLYDYKLNPNIIWLITCPNAIKLTPSGGRIRKSNNIYPKIINEKYKKL